MYLNLDKALNEGREALSHYDRYDLSTYEINAIANRSFQSPYGLITDGFIVGFRQGLKAAQAEVEKGGWTK